MIRKLSAFQRYVLTTALEEHNWKELVTSWNFQVDEQNKSRKSRGLKPLKFKRKDARKDSSTDEVGDVFEKIGWCTLNASKDYIVIGIHNPLDLLKQFWSDVKYWLKSRRYELRTIPYPDGSSRIEWVKKGLS